MLKREKEFTAKEISNGFVVTYSGRNENDDWVTEETYVENLQSLYEFIQGWYSMTAMD